MATEYRIVPSLQEGETCTWQVEMQHDDGSPVTVTDFTDIAVTLEDETGTIVNGRNSQEALGVNNVSIVDSKLSWDIQQADSTLLSQDPEVTAGIHTATFILIQTGGRRCVVQVAVPIERIQKF